jgi:putative acetyltransferase
LIREATAADLPRLAALYAASVRALGPSVYSAEQVDAWAQFAEDLETFGRFVFGVRTILIEDASGIVGFCGVDKGGHVASLYVRADRTREGIGTKLLQMALERAAASGIREFHAEASALSLPVFRRFGFVVCGTEKAVRGGVVFERYLVRRY